MIGAGLSVTRVARRVFRLVRRSVARPAMVSKAATPRDHGGSAGGDGAVARRGRGASAAATAASAETGLGPSASAGAVAERRRSRRDREDAAGSASVTGASARETPSARCRTADRAAGRSTGSRGVATRRPAWLRACGRVVPPPAAPAGTTTCTGSSSPASSEPTASVTGTVACPTGTAGSGPGTGAGASARGGKSVSGST